VDVTARLHELLLQFAPRERVKPGLERVRALCEALGHPETRFPAVHVAGTNGKGSVAVLVASALQRAGLKVGLYTSPHLVRWSERVQVDGAEIPVEQFVSTIERLEPVARKVEATAFELVSAVAFAHFAQQRVDLAVVEAGLGGRFDATNVVRPVVTVLTRVDLDHTQLLGETLERIAWEKVGIVKPGVPLVSAPLLPSVQRVVVEACRRQRAPLHVAPLFSSTAFDQTSQTVAAGAWGGVRLALLGSYQAHNLSVAVAALDVLQEQLDLDRGALKAGLERARWPGRFEFVGRQPLIVLDGAHNPAGASWLVHTLERYTPARPGRRWLLFGVRHDKDVDAITRTLFPAFERIHLVALPGRYGLDPEALLAYAQRRDPEAKAFSNVEAALSETLDGLKPDDLLCVAGSFVLVGEVRCRLCQAKR